VPAEPDAASAGAVWASVVQALGGARGAARAAGADLDARYAEAHRGYHGAAHVLAVVRDSSALAGELGVAPGDVAALTLAACAHDVVYDGRPGEDERASARWAQDQLAAAGVPGPVGARVAQLVLATLIHEAAGDDPAAAALLDADLAILAAAPADYDAYVWAVRGEYAHVDDTAWRIGRAAVLRSFADRERIYVSTPAHDRWEDAARANLARELATLEESP